MVRAVGLGYFPLTVLSFIPPQENTPNEVSHLGSSSGASDGIKLPVPGALVRYRLDFVSSTFITVPMPRSAMLATKSPDTVDASTEYYLKRGHDELMEDYRSAHSSSLSLHHVD